jgi:hypothetical protein
VWVVTVFNRRRVKIRNRVNVRGRARKGYASAVAKDPIFE